LVAVAFFAVFLAGALAAVVRFVALAFAAVVLFAAGFFAAVLVAAGTCASCSQPPDSMPVRSWDADGQVRSPPHMILATLRRVVNEIGKYASRVAVACLSRPM
jgi:hypothetical protein